jgi:tetratricopeptide (TPR) repeat protein
MRVTRFLTTVLLLATSSLIAPAAYGQVTPEETRARELYALGKKHFAASEYERAEASFSEGYALSHRSGFLWNMAQCARLRGEPKRALGLYRRYLKESPNDGERGEASKWVATLEAELGEANESAKASADRSSPASSSPSRLPEDAAQDDRSSDKTIPYVLGGIGIAGLAVGSVVGVMALSKKSTVDDECEGAACSSAGKDAADSGRSLAMVSNVGFGVGVAGLTAAVVMLVTKPKTEGAEHARGWTPTVAYDGRGGWVGATANW